MKLELATQQYSKTCDANDQEASFPDLTVEQLTGLVNAKRAIESMDLVFPDIYGTISREFRVKDPDERGVISKSDFKEILMRRVAPQQVSPEAIQLLGLKFEDGEFVDYQEFCDFFDCRKTSRTQATKNGRDVQASLMVSYLTMSSQSFNGSLIDQFTSNIERWKTIILPFKNELMRKCGELDPPYPLTLPVSRFTTLVRETIPTNILSAMEQDTILLRFLNESNSINVEEFFDFFEGR